MAEIAYPGTDKYSMAELIVILMARNMGGHIQIGSFGGGGKDMVLSTAAGNLLSAAAVAQTGGQTMGMGDTLPFGTWDPRLAAGAEYRGWMMDVVDGGVKVGKSILTRGHAGVGGMQIDKYGNLNMIGIGAGTYPRLKVRGPGSVGTVWNGAWPMGMYTQHHNKRVLVEKADYISGAGWVNGWDSRYKLYNDREGPERLFTSICVCDFTEDEHRMRLVSVHPGYTVKDVVDNTGFELAMPKNVPTTTPPTDYELELLRTRVDRGGQLRKWTRLTMG